MIKLINVGSFKMEVGSLVNDKRCRSTKFGKAGLILAIVGSVCWVMWPTAPDMPLWASADDLEVCV